MRQQPNFAEFLPALFGIFTRRTFRGRDYLSYLRLPAAQRSNDEAPVVDTAVVGPILDALGYSPAERAYNQQRQNGRPDFAPYDPHYGTCFVVEDKSTSLDLDLDISSPNSHISQLVGYLHHAGLRSGWLTNGRRMMVWLLGEGRQPECTLDIDLVAAITEWTRSPDSLSVQCVRGLQDFYELFNKLAFTSLERLEREIAIDLQTWRERSLPLGAGTGNDPALVEALRLLVAELQRDARRILEGHLQRYSEYCDRSAQVSDNTTASARNEINSRRVRVMEEFDRLSPMLGIGPAEKSMIASVLNRAERDAHAFESPAALAEEIVAILNQAPAPIGRSARLANLQPIPPVNDAVSAYGELVLTWHYREATLRQAYRDHIAVQEDYSLWTALVRETMLGGLDEEQRRSEFALQAAYVVFIRLFLIRVCEDKGIFPHRFISDGGISHWQEDIPKYLPFANGNPYTPLLDMAYANAQNIYAHFFTSRELFNWYRLDREHFVMALHRLSRFDFSGVDSDIVGTIYSTYVSRDEKRNKGQYYTPPPIVDYILDEIGYSIGPNIIGSGKSIIDPACGSGSFLVAAARRLIAAYQGQQNVLEDPMTVLGRVQSSIFGFDLNPFACYLAEVNLLVQVLDLVRHAHSRGERPHLQRFHIYNADALAKPTGVYRFALFNTLLADENDQVDQIKSRARGSLYENGFAFVVANPPYGAALSDPYKQRLRTDWPDVFFGQPDTYVFFLRLAVDLLGSSGRLGFITPNTYLMGANTGPLRKKLLETGRVMQIVDLPQGIWPDATVDCVLLFLEQDGDDLSRAHHEVNVHLLQLSDSLDKLTARQWFESLTQMQGNWLANEDYKITIRHDDLLKAIEEACIVQIDNGESRVMRLGDITDSSMGITVYRTRLEGRANLYVLPQSEVPQDEPGWEPLLDSAGYVGRFELRVPSDNRKVRYGPWLWRWRERKFFENPKLLTQDMRNRSLRRRLVATYDASGLFNRDNFNNIIQSDPAYNLKYILALFNSSLLNYWFARHYDNVNINPTYIRALPIFPAGADAQARIAAQVDHLLVAYSRLNDLRERGYEITLRRDGLRINIPYDLIVNELQMSRSGFRTWNLFDARAAGLFTIPESCHTNASISSTVHVPAVRLTRVVLRHNQLWLECADATVAEYLRGYLRLPFWRNKTWDEIKNIAVMPRSATDFAGFFDAVRAREADVQQTVTLASQLDAELDEWVLDLYGITEPRQRQRILEDAPRTAGAENDAADA